MGNSVRFAFAAALALLAPSLHGQDQKGEIHRRLSSEFTLTKTTADRSDIVTPGSVVVLQKDGLLLYSTEIKVSPTSSYKNGKLSISFGESMGVGLLLGQMHSGMTLNSVPQRKFVAGEKLWITLLAVKDDGVTLLLYSDPYDNVRYYGGVKIPFKKHDLPSADEALQMVKEVLTVQPPESDPVATGQPQSTATAQSTPALEEIPPPPPPADAPPPAPKTIALGQTKDQVVAAFGQPQKVVSLGAKDIYYYPDMKVTFVKGKVTDVQ